MCVSLLFVAICTRGIKEEERRKKWVGSEAKAQWARTNGDREDWGKKKQNLRETTPHPNVRPVR